MLITEENFIPGGVLSSAESSDIDNAKTNATSRTALITPVGGTAVVDFVPAATGPMNVFIWHQHTSTDDDAVLTVERFSDGAFSTSIDSEAQPLVPVYTGATRKPRPQERKQRVIIFQGPQPIRDVSKVDVGSVRFTVTNQTDPFEVGLIGAFDADLIQDGHVSGDIRDVTNSSSTQAKSLTAHGGGVTSVQKTTLRDYAYSLKNFSSADKETFLTIAETVNQTFPFCMIPIPNIYFGGKDYTHPGEEGGIVRLTSAVRFDLANTMDAAATDKYHAQNVGFRGWV